MLETTEGRSELSLELILENIDKLPFLPGVIFELMKHDREDGGLYDHVYELAKSDPPLALFILSYANSAASSSNQKIESLRVALTRVGATTVVELVTALSVSKVFIPKKPGHNKLWEHSIEVACIASFVSWVSQEHCIDPDLAYMCGLLHDIGRYVLFELVPDALDETDENGWGSPADLIENEKQIIGFTHAEVGYLACKKLNLPELVSMMVRYHHCYKVFNHPKAPEDLKNICLIIQFSDSLSVMLAKKPEWRTWTEENLAKNVRDTCVHEQWENHSLDIDSIVKSLPMVYEKIKSTHNSLAI